MAQAQPLKTRDMIVVDDVQISIPQDEREPRPNQVVDDK